MNWYAVFVESNKEMLVKQWIKYLFKECNCYSIVPKRKLIERKKGKINEVVRKLFPGYVFIYTDMSVEIYYKLTGIPGVLKILRQDGTYYSKINDEEMKPILKLIGNGEIIDYTQIYVEKTKVFVKSGPLKGMEGIIQKIDKRKRRAKILLELMSREKLVDVGIEVIGKGS